MNNNKINSTDNIEAIIFDLGGVLVDFDHMLAAKKILGFTSKSPQEIFNLFFDSGLTNLFEEGKISPQEFFSRVKEALNLRLDYKQFQPIFNEIFFFTERNQAVYNLAKALMNSYKVALLSNINILHFDYLKKNFPVFNAFHSIITSFSLGLRKPHPLIYKKALDILKAAPQNTFYTDDRIELITGARALGIRGFVFKSVEQLKIDLLDNGVSISPKKTVS